MDNEKKTDETFMQRAVGASLRISFIALLFVMSFWILKPFLAPVLWGIIFAVGIYPLHQKMSKWFGHKEKLAATMITVIGITIIVVPIVLFASSTVESVSYTVESIQDGSLKVSPPQESVKEWPLIGDKVHALWTDAANNLTNLLKKFEPQLRTMIPKLTSAVAGLAGSVLMFIISLVIAGTLLLFAEPGKILANKIFRTLVGENGNNFTELSIATVRSVVQGVIGIAAIQTVFLSIGFFMIDLPAAGVFSIVVLILAIVQLPPTIIVLPLIIYVFSYAGTTPAIVFAVWSIFWSIADTFLKPLMLGKGVDVPMLVILLGAIGGMILGGPVGLFVGSVVLALSYKILMAMLDSSEV
ncbi:AI-2E family transporter [Carboxylicivirga sp. M1479]|uniref:AI-2E family transporter n=1 Tax=Carboxylicivirga sp. M1479 TaxID=2594476 RepID=UPI00117754A6|nr:AI-2E family transporter [Carboxylicivirga sp. M1479]TRX62382.1 AI-2E family transporter [Carboxylicivirga sp. M1479]